MERRLAAILAADVVGYSKLMGNDETGTLSTLSDIFENLINPMIEGHNGRVVKLMGDGILAEFGSVVDSVACAIEWQKIISAENGEFQFRIGINLGDIVFQDNDIFGNGVIVAARLERLADPGGILVSDDIYRQAKGNFSVNFEDMGEQNLKNIEEPVRTYRVIGEELENSLDVENTVKPAHSANPSIAVLPFENMSNDREQEYFADGVTEEIITTLSKVPNLLVIARNSTFVYKGQSVDIKQVGAEQGVSYVLEGSIRKSANRVRITAQLIDAKNGHHLWAERYDREIDDIFELQDEIALKVATEIQVELTEGEMARFRGSGTKNLEAWGEQIRAVACTRVVTKESFTEARRFAENARRIDPGYAAPLCILGFVNTVEARHGFSASRSASIAEARKCAENALAIDPYNPEAHGVLGFADTLEGFHEKAIEKFKTALDINPNHADVSVRLAITLAFNDQPEEGIKIAEKAIQLNPKYPGFYAGIYGFALRMVGRYDEAIDAFLEYSRLVTGFGHVDLVIVYALTNKMDLAKREAHQVLLHRPDFTISKWAETQLYTNSDRLRIDKDALQQAGLPD